MQGFIKQGIPHSISSLDDNLQRYKTLEFRPSDNKQYPGARDQQNHQHFRNTSARLKTKRDSYITTALSSLLLLSCHALACAEQHDTSSTWSATVKKFATKTLNLWRRVSPFTAKKTRIAFILNALVATSHH
jgi:hypothetical protein